MKNAKTAKLKKGNNAFKRIHIGQINDSWLNFKNFISQIIVNLTFNFNFKPNFYFKFIF